MIPVGIRDFCRQLLTGGEERSWEEEPGEERMKCYGLGLYLVFIWYLR